MTKCPHCGRWFPSDVDHYRSEGECWEQWFDEAANEWRSYHAMALDE